MSMHAQLERRARDGEPVRVALVGAGKFGSMYLSQARRVPGIHIAAIVDLAPENAHASLRRVGWGGERFAAASMEEAAKDGSTFVTDDAGAVIPSPFVDIVVDATGSPPAGIRHVLMACEHGKHVIMVNVEADSLAGPLLARRAAEAGIVYSMASGDQPALIAEMVDWARINGMDVVCAGKGTRYIPSFHQSTPDTVWDHFGFTEEQLANGDFNPKMYNSFIDGTKSSLEMAAVANACRLDPPSDGLMFPPCGVHDLQNVLRPAAEGGVLERKGVVEVVSSQERDGREVHGHLRQGVYVVFEGDSQYTRDCFAQYGLHTDETGRYAASWKPFHLIGLELGTSVASIATRGEPTGSTSEWRGDVLAVAKRPLKKGEMLDGEGGYTVHGKLVPVETSLAMDALPLGLASGVRLKSAVPAGVPLRWKDVEYDTKDEAVAFRREMESVFGAEKAA